MPDKTYANILYETRAGLGLQPDQGHNLPLLIDAFRDFWDIAPWRETIEQMDPFWLTPGFCIYKAPIIVFPDDFRDLYSAEIVTIGLDTYQHSEELKIIGNMVPTNTQGQPRAIGYSFQFKAFLVDRLPNCNVGREYIIPIYKKDYPIEMDLNNINTESFPFKRNEGAFKTFLGWYIKAKPSGESDMVSRALSTALRAENPGMQSNVQPPRSRYSDLGL